MGDCETMDYGTWFARVNRQVVRISGVGADDLPDQSWRDWFDDGMTPNEAAREALANEGF